MTSPDLPTLYQWFDDGESPPAYQVVSDDDVPEPYRGLLVHTEHMTVTVEAYYKDRVAVLVRNRARRGDVYARKIYLALEGDGRVVQFGIVTIRLDLCTPAVRDAILAEGTPLGRVLIEHNVYRWIKPTAYLRVQAAGRLAEEFGLAEPRETYGRLGYIYCDGQPAIELLEILAPITP
jgi:chorismate-pyruvate lyase